jgi:anti-sigma factor RsiW
LTCERARALLWPPERPRLAKGDVVPARAHLAECASCQAYLAQDDLLLSAYDRIRAEGAPSEVKDRVLGSCGPVAERSASPAEPRSRGWGAQWLGWSLAAGLAILVGFNSGVGRPVPETATGDVFLEDYLRRAVSEDHITTSDPTEVARFLLRELGLSLRPIEVEGMTVEGAEVCLLEGRRGAMILYKVDGRTVSHYLVPNAGAAARPPSHSATLEGTHDPTVVTWSAAEVEHALVGPVDGAQLLRLAVVAAAQGS